LCSWIEYLSRRLGLAGGAGREGDKGLKREGVYKKLYIKNRPPRTRTVGPWRNTCPEGTDEEASCPNERLAKGSEDKEQSHTYWATGRKHHSHAASPGRPWPWRPVGVVGCWPRCCWANPRASCPLEAEPVSGRALLARMRGEWPWEGLVRGLRQPWERIRARNEGGLEGVGRMEGDEKKERRRQEMKAKVKIKGKRRSDQ